MLNTGILKHCGIMVNYKCNAACRHCLYSCSPSRRGNSVFENKADNDYITENTADRICNLLRNGGCRSVHIGGGEPFLNFNGLLMMVKALSRYGINLDYVETNALWALNFKKKDENLKKLETLLMQGVNVLCISIDPFHAEFVPYNAPLILAELCRLSGMDFFLWKNEFYSVLINSGLDSGKIHSRQEMENAISKNYLFETSRNYRINFGGRAVNIEREFCALYPAENFLSEKNPCRNLLSTEHFHVDMHGFFIPPRCTGICIPLEEAAFGIQDGKYKVFEVLYSGGISRLMNMAVQYGFVPNDEGYPSKCNLCFYIRKFLSEKNFPELDKNHYEEALK